MVALMEGCLPPMIYYHVVVMEESFMDESFMYRRSLYTGGHQCKSIGYRGVVVTFPASQVGPIICIQWNPLMRTLLGLSLKTWTG